MGDKRCVGRIEACRSIDRTQIVIMLSEWLAPDENDNGYGEETEKGAQRPSGTLAQQGSSGGGS